MTLEFRPPGLTAAAGFAFGAHAMKRAFWKIAIRLADSIRRAAHAA